VHLLGVDFSKPKSFLLLVTVVFGLCGIGIVALRRSAFGRRLVALRDSEAASVTVGVNVLETKLVVFALSAGISGFAGAFIAMSYGKLSGATGFEALSGLPIVLALVIGGVGFVAGALFAGVFGLILIFVQSDWHISLWLGITYLAPGLAVLGIIQNPSGAVVPIGEGFARLLPWRKDAKLEYQEMIAANAEPEVGELGTERPFAEADVLLVDRGLGISNDVPRPVATARSG
jgi:branched-chain amino acid transport system permease protein